MKAFFGLRRRRGGSLDAAIFGAKASDILKFIVCPLGLGRGGVEPVRTATSGRGQYFCDFMRTSFMDGPQPKSKIL